jgi:pyridoxamine 5'-phosphate oxidase
MAGPLRRSELAADPVEQFGRWYAEAEAATPMPDAMVLATVGEDGGPRARFVLLKEFGPDGFRFHSDYRSPKGEQLAANPRGAITFWWHETGRQVRIVGKVERLGPQESDDYFRTRPRERQLGAWALRQSQPIGSREELDEQVAEVERRFDGAIPRPEHWGGFRLVPQEFEFWNQGETRLHDRFRYRLDDEGNWQIERLSP